MQRNRALQQIRRHHERDGAEAEVLHRLRGHPRRVPGEVAGHPAEAGGRLDEVLLAARRVDPPGAVTLFRHVELASRLDLDILSNI